MEPGRRDVKKRWTWGTMTFSVHEIGEAERVDLAFTCSRCGTSGDVQVRRERQVSTARTIKTLHACDEALAAMVLES